MVFGVIVWVATGLLVGFIAGKFIDLHGDDPRLGPAIACAAGIVAAFLYTVISGAPVSPWNFWAVLFAACGVVGGVIAWHLIRSRSVSHAPYSRRSSY